MDKTSTLTLLTAPKSKKEKSEDLGFSLNHDGPSDAVINNLLNYSKALTVTPSKSIGYVENLLN
jgi:hypothetical protein